MLAFMARIRVVFANICQGLKTEGRKNKREVFSKYWPSAYKDVYVPLQPDIVCFAEVPMSEDGSSEFLRDFSEAMEAVDYRADLHERSWLVEGNYYGNAIVSKYAFKEYKTFKLPNPQFEVDNPDGSHWFLHDKTVQYATVEVAATPIRLFNLHYFPFHRFKHNMNEPELEPIRKAFIDQLRLEDDIPTILAGDFNNGNDHLSTAYPELFHDDKLVDSVRFGPEQFDDYYTSDKFQLDHVLYTMRSFAMLAGRVVRDPSDHRGIVVDLELSLSA